MRRATIRHFAATAAAVLALSGCGGSDDKSTSQPAPTPQANSVAATRGELLALANQVGHDIFWAGPKRGFTYELTRTKNGQIYIRYLPPGVPVGAGSADFLSVGTYPTEDAFSQVQTARKRSGERVTKLPGGGLAVASRERPTSVYVAYPGSKLLVEVYDPNPTRAKNAIVSGQVRPLR